MTEKTRSFFNLLIDEINEAIENVDFEIENDVDLSDTVNYILAIKDNISKKMNSLTK